MASSGIVSLSNGVAQNLLITGYKCWVRAGNNATSAKKIGFIDSFSATKQIQTQQAQVIGSIMAASIDPQSYSVTLNMTGFLATPAVYKGTASYNGGGTISLQSFNPKSSDFISGAVATKFPYMDFYDDKEEIVLASFDNAISTSFGLSGQGGAYVKANIAMQAIDMSDGDTYMSQTTSNTSLTK